MSPQLVQLIIFALSEAVKQYPEIRAAIAETLSKDNPTPEDWEALKAKLQVEDYFSFVPDSALPRDSAEKPPTS